MRGLCRSVFLLYASRHFRAGLSHAAPSGLVLVLANDQRRTTNDQRL